MIPAVGYARCSTDQQDTSVADQIKAVTRYAEAHGYNILRWYADEGISGDATEKRVQFLRMRDDASDRGDFAAILCWNQERFGRFDQIDAGYWIRPLRKAGVYLVTLDRGRVDWETLQGQLLFTVDQMAKHQYLLTLSRDVCRGMLVAADNGGWLGTPPYAYALEGPKKKRLLVVGDIGKVRIVQRIFREYVDERRSLREIAARLTRDGVPTPSGRKSYWRPGVVAGILANPAYVGDRARERYSGGKYSTIRADSVVKGNGQRRRPRAEWRIERDRHKPLIDRATWDAAQRILAESGRLHSRRYGEVEPALFTCRLYSGKCGALLHAVGNERNRCRRGQRRYKCSAFRRPGAAACAGTIVAENDLLVSLAEHLEKWIGLTDAARERETFREWLTAGNPLPAVYQEVRDLIAPPPASTPRQDRHKLEKHAEKLRTLVKTGQAGLAYLTEEERGPAREDIQAKKDELRLCEEELERTKQPTAAEVNRLVEGVLESLFGLALCCRALARHRATRPTPDADPDADFPADAREEDERWYWDVAAPDAVRQLLSRIGHIVVHTTQTGSGTHVRHHFARGEIVFAGSSGVRGGTP
jgi:DNA invertase Pin-like site-specific DNA recombinase